LNAKHTWIVLGAVGVVGGLTVAWRESGLSPKPRPAVSFAATESAPVLTREDVRVQVVRPTRGTLERRTVQPGSLHSFESAALFAKVSGYLKTQQVDIGDKVKRGQVLALIDAPELDIEVQRLDAALTQAKAEVEQMRAHLGATQAKWQAAVAGVTQAEAEVGRATAQRTFREKQYQRIKRLFDLNSIDERLVDEKLDEMEAARAAERAAQAAVATARAEVVAAAAQIEEAKANG